MKNRPEHLQPRFKHELLVSSPNRLKSSGLSSIKLTDDERILFETQALDIFTQCSNSGLPFRQCLSSIILSGFDWGVNACKETG